MANFLGTAGPDTYRGTSGADTIRGMDGNDFLDGRGGNDIINGHNGNDRIFGGTGHDMLNGGTGRDTIDGGDGNDIIIGHTGGDELTGGAGADIFVYRTTKESMITHFSGGSDTTNSDTIIDFDLARDRIDLSAIDADTTTPGKQDFIWGGSGVGHLESGSFIGTDLVADTNGDGKYDFYIYLPSVLEGQYLTEANFIL